MSDRSLASAPGGGYLGSSYGLKSQIQTIASAVDRIRTSRIDIMGTQVSIGLIPRDLQTEKIEQLGSNKFVDIVQKDMESGQSLLIVLENSTNVLHRELDEQNSLLANYQGIA